MPLMDKLNEARLRGEMELLAKCIVALPESVMFTALENALTPEQKEELGERWFNVDREG